MKLEKAFKEYEERFKEIHRSNMTSKERNNLQKEVAKKYGIKTSDFREYLTRRALGIHNL